MNRIKEFILPCLLSATLGLLLHDALLPKAHAQAAPAARTTEYKVVAARYGGITSSIDKFKMAQEKALNEFAKDGWRLTNTAPLGESGYVLLYLER